MLMVVTPLESLIAENVRNLRKQKGLTQEEFAQLLAHRGLKWNQSHVSKAEAGRTNALLRVDVLMIIADALDVTFRMLFHCSNGPSDECPTPIRLGHIGAMEANDFWEFFEATKQSTRGHILRVRDN